MNKMLNLNNEMKNNINIFLKKNHFNISETFEEYFSRKPFITKRYYYTLICNNQKKKKYFFKLSITHNPDYVKAIKNEINCYKIIKNIQFKKFSIPKIKSLNIGSNIGYIRKFIDGNIIGNYHKIDKEAVNESQLKCYCEKLLEIISEILNSRKNILKKTTIIRNVDLKYYLHQIKENNNCIKNYIPKYYNKVNEIFLKNRMGILNNDYFCHGDFYFGNMIFSKDTVTIIDWSQAHFGNISEDFAKLMISLWQFPKLQRRIYNGFLENIGVVGREQFDKSFKFMLLYQCSKELYHWIRYNDFLNKKDNYYDKNLLKNAFEYFYNLLNGLLNDKKIIINKYLIVKGIEK